ncbi:glycine--tRNA ligase subunit alpha [Buchnera aphidicola]|uniref:glycine--tRNA ligase subunit alpha n=1 Tax=Buchnera aphidicola TaxID=9 RepID=UPI0030EF4621
MKNKNIIDIYNTIKILEKYWNKNNCIILQPLDLPIGAGTFHYKTFFSCLEKNDFAYAYPQLSRRPTDGRNGKNINRLQKYYQFQVIIKPPPKNIQKIYLKSLKKLKINTKRNDIKFIEDNWENPTLGACGIGWEVWLNGMEITQFTYFQQIGGLDCKPVAVEITYGIERLSTHIQKVKNIYKLIWNNNKKYIKNYHDLFFKEEVEESLYNFKKSNSKFLFSAFKLFYNESKRLIKKHNLLIPAYKKILYSIHFFNLLDARKVLSSSERQNYIIKIRKITKKIAEKYLKIYK